MIFLDHVDLQLGSRTLFVDANLSIPLGSRVGLIGPNGCGKTSLFRLLIGEIQPDAGRAGISSARRVAYLSQAPDFPEDARVRSHVLESHPAIWQLGESIGKLEAQMATEHDPGRLDRLVERHRQQVAQYEDEGGRECERRVDRILGFLGVPMELHDAEICRLSGGEKKRVALARVLFSGADVLLLDEPTNYLDLDGLDGFEEYLLSAKTTVLVASHDRYLLNRVAENIVEIRGADVHAYPGNYDAYVRQFEESAARAEKLEEARRGEIAREEEFVRRNFYGMKARQAKSRLKRIERLESGAIDVPRGEWGRLSVRFDRSARGGDEVLRAEELSCGYDGQALVSDARLDVQRGERVAILGRNGVGKSTLLRCLGGEHPPLDGAVKHGPRTRVGVYRQEPAEESSPRSVFDAVHDMMPTWTHQQVRDLLARFLFREERLETAVRDLSGGEKARLALIRVALSEANLLLLDEPTTHLDIPSREALEVGLQAFPETILFVSHDRYFIDKLADRVLLIENGHLRELVHGFDDYRRELRRRRREEESGSRGAAAAARPARERKLSPGQRARLEKRRVAREERLLEKIQALERQLEEKHLETAREDVYRDPEALKAVKAAAAAMEEEIAALYGEWEALHNEE